jgi:hypothetical protein
LRLVEIDGGLSAHEETAAKLNRFPTPACDSARPISRLYKTVLAGIAADGGDAHQDLLD